MYRHKLSYFSVTPMLHFFLPKPGRRNSFTWIDLISPELSLRNLQTKLFEISALDGLDCTAFRTVLNEAALARGFRS